MTFSFFSLFVASCFVFGIAIQIITIVIFKRIENRHCQLAPYFINVAISNLVLIVASYPFSFVSSLEHRWIGRSFGCELSGFLVGLCIAVSFVTTAVFTCKIYTHVTSDNVNINQVMEAKRESRNAKIFAGIWLFSAACVFPPLVGWSSMTEQLDHTRCAPSVGSDAERLSYVVFHSISVFLVPMGISLVLLAKLYRYFKDIRNHDVASPSLQKLHSYKKMQKVVVAAVIANTIFWAPSFICSLALSIGGGTGSPLGLMPAYFSMLGPVFMPAVCWYIIPRYRRGALNLFSMFRCGPSGPSTGYHGYQYEERGMSLAVGSPSVILERTMLPTMGTSSTMSTAV